MSVPDAQKSRWSQAIHAAALLAVDPMGTGGVSLRARPGPTRDTWLAEMRAMLPPSATVRKIPCTISDSRLLGGLDLAATLQAGRPVIERGVLCESDDGVVIVAMAERMTSGVAARLAAVLDHKEILIERDGIAARAPAAISVVALDEGIDEEGPPAALLDRLAIHLDLDGVRCVAKTLHFEPGAIAAARIRLNGVGHNEAAVRLICKTCSAFGIASMRAASQTLRAARAAAALAGRAKVAECDLSLAASLVLAPRATMLPVSDETPDANEPEAPSKGDHDRKSENDPAGVSEPQPPSDGPLGEIVLEAVRAAIPAGLLAELSAPGGSRARASAGGRVGALQMSIRRGRPAGVRQGEPKGHARLNVIETLRAAAPLQPLRRRTKMQTVTDTAASPRIEVRRTDFRVTRLKQRAESVTIFVVDASGSSALHRLAEAKGAVELLLADCYARRDRVAVLAFRGRGVEMVLPPTRSIARARRNLAGLPGGGGTPLAAAIDAAAALADQINRKGQTPTVVLLTDGQANVARDGRGDRRAAEQDALAASRLLRAARLSALVIDTSRQPNPAAQRLAGEMAARYLPLPFADANAMCNAARTAASRA